MIEGAKRAQLGCRGAPQCIQSMHPSYKFKRSHNSSHCGARNKDQECVSTTNERRATVIERFAIELHATSIDNSRHVLCTLDKTQLGPHAVHNDVYKSELQTISSIIHFKYLHARASIYCALNRDTL